MSTHSALSCLQQVAPPGSDLYYAVRFGKPEYPERMAALFALKEALTTVITQTKDNTVALRTLFWWKDEIAKIGIQIPSHPITQTLHQLAIQNIPLPSAIYFENLVVETMQQLSRPLFENFEAWIEHHQKTPSALHWLIGQTPLEEQSTLQTLHCSIVLAQNIRHLHEKKSCGLHFITQTDAQTCGYSLDTWMPDDVLIAVLKKQAERSFQYYAQSKKQIIKSAIGKSIHIMAALEKATLQEIARANYPVLTQNIALTPLRKCWIAYTTARRS